MAYKAYIATEAEARAALAAFDGLGGLERWIAAQTLLAASSLLDSPRVAKR